MSLNDFEKMEDPKEREAADLVRKKSAKASYKKKSRVRSVSISTFKFGTGFVSFVVWAVFLAIVGYGTYQIIGLFTNN